MPNTEKQKSEHATLFIDFVIAELHTGKNDDWRVVYYAKIPGKNQLKRFRKRVPKLKSVKDRKMLAQQICHNINQKLKSGWSPFFDTITQNEFQLFSGVLDKYLKQTEFKTKDQIVRPDTLRSYRSFVKNIQKYLSDSDKSQMLAAEFDREFVVKFRDHLYYERELSPRTANNYLDFLSQIALFMMDRKLIPANPTERVERLKQVRKKREVLPEWLRNDIFNYLKYENRNYLALCLTTYFCFVRRTEMTKLKVKHISLKNATIFIPGESSKNKRDGTVTIPKQLLILLAEHLTGANNDDYLFSNDAFKPGRKQLQPKKISDEWAKLRVVLKFDDKYQFYSLKDTGITNLLLMGIPAKKVRDQARHHDIRITESYVSRTDTADEELRSIDFRF